MALALCASNPARASLSDQRGLAPEAVWPPAGATVQEGDLGFAWSVRMEGARHLLILSRRPFETRGWTRLPDDPEIEVHALAHPAASLSDVGVTLEGETRLYWAAASQDPGAGHVSFGEVRWCRVLPRFSNRVEPSPYLRVTRIGEAPVETGREPDRIRLRAGYEIDPAGGEPALPGHLRGSSGLETDLRTLLVYFGDADPARVLGDIRSAGGSVIAYIPDRTFLARMRPAAQFSLAAESAWVGAYQPAYKLSPRVEIESAAPRVSSVLLFPDGDLASVTAAVAGAGGEVLASSNNGINKILKISASGPALSVLARHPDVSWIEPYVRPQVDNVDAQWVVQTNGPNNRRVWDMGIRGQGQVVMTSDTGIDVAHDQFRDPSEPIVGFGDYPAHRKVIAYHRGSGNPDVTFGDLATISYHGTHTACTAAGNDDPNASDLRDGMAKEAKLYFMDIWGPALGNIVDPFPDLNDLFLPSYLGNAGGAARISSTSWGAAVNGDYTIESLNVDQFMWNHPDYLVFVSNGNDGAGHPVRAPATAKSAVGAGATGNGAESANIGEFTSRGPTSDGRRKPTICAPGRLNSASRGPSNYQTLSGTSMSSPAMAGAAALMRQYLTEGWYPTGSRIPANGFNPSAALLKAMCVNSAVDQVNGFRAPDNNIGYGRINADNVLYFAGDARQLLLVDFTPGLGHLQSIEYQVNVSDGTQPLEVTLCWTDFPGHPSAGIQIVNDLDLTVTNGATTFKGNVYASGFSTTGGQYDRRNVEEAVLVQAPAPGLWTIRIDAFNVPIGPQAFGLCVTGGLGSSAGTVTLDRASYGSASAVGVRVIDLDAGPTVAVTLTSPTEPGGETLSLAGANGVYEGSIPLSPFPGDSGDGVLQVSSGDLITATYRDSSPEILVSTSAGVSFTSPLVTGVSATAQGNRAVLVSWTTDRNASSRVYYGPTSTLGEATPLDPTAVFDHQVLVSNLAVGQTYFYDVESQDLSGNLTRDDNGGAHYRFTVEPPSDMLLVYGGPSFERSGRYADALASLRWSYDVWQGPLSRNPQVGDRLVGMRSYKLVWWQVGLETYPPFTDAARESLTRYLDGGGRLAVVGHDIAWSFGSPSAFPFHTAAREAWLRETLHTIYNLDPSGWSRVVGISGDPISGDYSGGVSYSEHRPGASGDEIDSFAGDGTVAYTWRSSFTPDHCGLRWESNGARGSSDRGFWGGMPSRLTTLYFEWSGIDPTRESSIVRTDIMDKTQVWLLGRERPKVALAAPLAGSTVTTDTVSIRWNESTAAGAGVAQRVIEYSADGGASWVTIEASAGPSPLLWNLGAVPNSQQVRVRVRVTDNGAPPFIGSDVGPSFALQRPNGDTIGPVVVAGSVRVDPNPVRRLEPATLTAMLTDAPTGGGDVVGAEWSLGEAAAPPGGGNAMTGAFGSTVVAVSASLPTGEFTHGQHALWVRGRDQAGNWGPARALEVVVNAQGPGGPGPPRALELRQNAPNPVLQGTTITYALPVETPVRLSIFDVRGRRVRDLVQGPVPAGDHEVTWDGSDGDGRRVDPGLYFYRLTAAGRTLQRRMVTLR